MRITKRQLKRIIREERTRLLKESMTDMTDVQEAINKASMAVGDVFHRKMIALFDEAPEMLSDVTDERGRWEAMVNDAVLEVDTGIDTAIENVLQEIEDRLINGDY